MPGLAKTHLPHLAKPHRTASKHTCHIEPRLAAPKLTCHITPSLAGSGRNLPATSRQTLPRRITPHRNLPAAS
jgi:hypothetical protein